MDSSENGNLLLEQYGRFKRMELKKSPFHFLLASESHIDPNPHQINAFCAAIDAMKTGGMVLADEVGLGKTIEAGLVLRYMLESGAKKVLIALPVSLRKQWELELEDKFDLSSVILDRLTVEHDAKNWHRKLADRQGVMIVITSYDYSSKLMKRFPDVKWDFLIIDEAHNLRNLNSTKRAKRLYALSGGIPKILLTATPLQNSLMDLYGLISFIDPRIFGSEQVFRQRYMKDEDYDGLKRELTPVLYRTLRKDVVDYMHFVKRICRTVDFKLSPDEIELYERVNLFLKGDALYSIPASNRGLIILVIRKLMASSSFALVETFEVLKKRLEKLYEGTRSADAQEGFDLFWSFVEDEIDESGFEETEDEDTAAQKTYIQAELDKVNAIIDVAKRIKTNSKVTALKQALEIGFSYQRDNGIAQKAVVFTESKRTQKYIAAELRKSGYSEDNILLFNGDFDDTMTKEIYRAWQVKNFGNANYGRSVEYKHAIVDYFKEHAKILICTDAGSEGLNLQFCNTVINYDLPWNPMKIEQRIGRCHRYGQQNDVVAINLLNTQNEADKRVYEILSKKFELFEGVFGASDIVLGALESGTSFEKMVLDIYQSCNTTTEFRKAFDKLDRKLNAKRDKNARKLRSILITESSGAKKQALKGTRKDIDHYLQEVDYWDKVAEPEVFSDIQYWKVDDWGEQTIGAHGYLFLGAMCNNADILFPVLLLCDQEGKYVDFEEDDLVPELEKIDDSTVRYFKPTDDENTMFRKTYGNLVTEMLDELDRQTEPVREYNRRKIENWIRIQNEQLVVQYQEMNAEIEGLRKEEKASNNFYEKIDIRKKADQKQKKLELFQASFHERGSRFRAEGEREIAEFNRSLEIDNPVLLISVVLKF
ncbi:helicase [Bifidobacterium adolescentis]|uniref:DISARM system SNF2-like helicase DrmD n=1 Tax=Bifidobacterium adolescentis TaxID=1680 RepID=UPI000585EA89|nr:DISARM system SNF2-like helicase DrmD [Bifidobacterium adolescentis]AJE06326.1 helicase [Bifidobacterium adolescentis]MDB1494635.1 DISARM system SNF2-like helicase DrmD [Bifidobacterium adolescentis]MDB1498161.1 DISARM system SNF2-like helicase DrmD [Bifidobacterium adolescentis]